MMMMMMHLNILQQNLHRLVKTITAWNLHCPWGHRWSFSSTNLSKTKMIPHIFP